MDSAFEQKKNILGTIREKVDACDCLSVSKLDFTYGFMCHFEFFITTQIVLIWNEKAKHIKFTIKLNCSNLPENLHYNLKWIVGNRESARVLSIIDCQFDLNWIHWLEQFKHQTDFEHSKFNWSQ